MRVSIDAPDKDRYIETRRCPQGHWDRVWRNVVRLAEITKYTETVFGLGYVVTPESWDGILDFTKAAKLAGVDNVRITAMFSTEDEKPFVEIYDEITEMVRDCKELSNDSFTVYDNFGSRYADLAQHNPDYKLCPYQYYTTYIGGDLRVYRCCVLAYNRRGLVRGGDLRGQRFSDFWNSDERKRDFDSLNAQGCPRCQFNGKNRQLLDIMNDGHRS